jgi:hypothetical protein
MVCGVNLWTDPLGQAECGGWSNQTPRATAYIPNGQKLIELLNSVCRKPTNFWRRKYVERGLNGLGENR